MLVIPNAIISNNDIIVGNFFFIVIFSPPFIYNALVMIPINAVNPKLICKKFIIMVINIIHVKIRTVNTTLLYKFYGIMLASLL